LRAPGTKRGRRTAPATLSARLGAHVALEARAGGNIVACFDGHSVGLGKFSAGAADRAQALRTGLPLGAFESEGRSIEKEVQLLVRRLAGHGLLEYRLGQKGRDAMGFAVHVPHYLAQSEYPAAAERLLTAASKATGLLLPTEDLRAAAEVARAEIDQQVEQAEEASSVVRSLEQQYDAFIRGQEGTSLLAEQTGPLPTADELGAELERFLAEQTRPNDPPTAG